MAIEPSELEHDKVGRGGRHEIFHEDLEGHPRFEICADVEDGAKAIAESQRLKPDVVVLNVNMPVLCGFQAAHEIKASLPKTAIIILSSHVDQCFIEEARRIGARAYVAKTELGTALVKAIEATVVGGDFCFNGVTSAVPSLLANWLDPGQ